MGVPRTRVERIAGETIGVTADSLTGPYADRPATEFTLQAATGFIARRGTPERGPVGAGGRLGEYAAGTFAAVAAAAAWIGARASGAVRSVWPRIPFNACSGTMTIGLVASKN